MNRTRGFTLIELLVVISIIALLIAFLMPGLGKARELAKRTACANNVNNVGKAIAMYQGTFNDWWPWMSGAASGWNTTATGTAYDRTSGIPGGDPKSRNVSALLFLLVRESQQSPSIFICPSSPDKADSNPKETDGQKEFHWDFTPYSKNNSECISYSFQAPLNDSSTTYATGVTTNSDPAVAVLSDRTCAYDRDAMNDTTLGPDYNWANQAQEGTKKAIYAMPQNHSGEYMNVLFADVHVSHDNRADIGYGKDNIFTVASPGVNNGEYDPGKGTLTMDNHKKSTDSFLIGPIRKK